MSKRQPARNPFSFKKITLPGGGGVSGGSEEGSINGSASNNHLEEKCKFHTAVRRLEGFPVSAQFI
jgi:hypothetical protein